MNFDDLDISDNIKKSITDMGFSKLTPIQKVAIPHALEGIDLIAQAQTGSGKTFAFAIPILEKIFIPDKSPQAIVLCPTRELALQVALEFNKLSSNIKKLKILAVYGGEPIGKQSRFLKKGVHIIVGTPGRVIDHIERGNLDLIGIETVVLDEADEMLDMGFRDDIEIILSKTPHQRQTLLFSATIPPEIKSIAENYQKDSKIVKISDKKENRPNISQFAFPCNKKNKFKELFMLIQFYYPKRILIFCNTKKKVKSISKKLNTNFDCDYIHGDIGQKKRNKALNKFKNSNIRILVASDVASRGLDIPDVDIVINYDVPHNFDDYIHRIGRTARAGKSGLAFSLVMDDESSRFENIKKENKTPITVENMLSYEKLIENTYKKILNEAFKNKDLKDYIEVIENNVDSKNYLKLAASLLKMINEK